MENNLTITGEQLQSKVISFLRFPLCVAVVLIHIEANTSNCPVHPIHDFVHYLFAQILTRVAVPLFFMFSGFLFFYKIDDFTFASYRNKLAKRARTLLVPYLFWNFMPILYYLLGRLLGLGSQYGAGFDLFDWLRPFWNHHILEKGAGIDIASYPITIQFWYIRDLMVTILLSPIIYWLIKKCHIYIVLALAALWITNYWPLITGFNITALFFFSLGAYFSIFKKNFVELLKPHTLLLGIAYLLIVIPILIAQNPNFNPLRRVGILVGMAFTLSLAAKYISNGKWRTNRFLSESSFFIFAYHMLVGVVVGDIIESYAFNKDILCAIQYLAKSGIIVIAGLAIYYLLKKFMPRFTALITGGR